MSFDKVRGIARCIESGLLRWGQVLVGCALCLTPLLAQSPTFRYFYDDTNQLIKVLDTTGNLIEYVYDGTGNPTQVLRSIVAPGALSLLNITPRQGGPGTVITLYGQGFSTTATNDVVMFNGVAVTVIAASATELTVTIPPGVTSGTVTVTVGGQTVTSGTIQFSALPPPTITALAPDGAITGAAINLTVTGSNLDEATFSTSPAGALTFNGVATSTSANGLATVLGAPGLYAVVATNIAGSSNATLTPANRFTILPSSGEGDTFVVTVLNLAAPPTGTPDPTAVANEASTASVSVLNKSAPPAGTADPTAVSNEAGTPPVTVLNTTPPPAGTADPTAVSNESTSPPVAVLNTQAPPPGTPDPTVVDETDGSVVTVLDPSGSGRSVPSDLAGAAAALATPAVRISGAGESSRLISGQTAVIGVEPAALIREAQLFVNGVPFESLRAAPFEATFTAPAGMDLLDLRFELRDAEGKEILAPAMPIPIVPDPLTEVSGRATDSAGQPLEGRLVTLEAQGLLAEYFHFDTPLAALPEVADLKPVKTTVVSGLNLKNPQHVFGNDPLGLGLGPDYAARFRGEIRIAKGGGKYGLFLRAHKGARLKIDSKPVLETPPGDGELAEANSEVTLTPGWHKIEILYFETVGAPQLDLEWAPPGEIRGAIPPASLRVRDESHTAITDVSGEFRIRNVPSNLDQIQVAIEAAEPVTSAPVKPMPGGVSRVGEIKVDKR